MNQDYQHEFSETIQRYGPKIKEAIKQLKDEYPNFGRHQIGESVLEARCIPGVGFTRISLNDLKRLEQRVRKITGDFRIRLVGSPRDYFSYFVDKDRPLSILL